MRGRVFLANYERAGVRITPARAGKRTKPLKPVSLFRDHPRACGEEGVFHIIHKALEGSPPRVRGRGRRHPRPPGSDRITPARAGKSCSPAHFSGSGRDHPRACGEEFSSQPVSWPTLGSPPRVRGRGGLACISAHSAGITPARAGKSERREVPPRGGRDHPRACGEEPDAVLDELGWQGSPPRVRGRDAWIILEHDPLRITPARAGKREHRPSVL